jgi:hypothetical protein
MLAWALQTAELAAKAGMAATKLGGLSALLRGPPAVLHGRYWGCVFILPHSYPWGRREPCAQLPECFA